MATRRLPSLTGLRSFDATARHNSFSRAADELCVTQGAVSRQVAKLEADLCVALFLRRGRRLMLTDEGQRFHAFIREAFQRITDGVSTVTTRPIDSVLKIKVPPTLGIRWFVPRLVHFHANHPQYDVQITTSHQPVNFDTQDVDAAINWGSGEWPGLHTDFLIGEELTPVCNLALLRDGALRRPADVANHVLLHSMNRRNDWERWLSAAKVEGFDLSRVLRFENSGLTYQAAIEGLGLVVAQCAFIKDDLATGRLVAPFPLVVPGEMAYYLVFPPERISQPKVSLFRDWLLSRQ